MNFSILLLFMVDMNSAEFHALYFSLIVRDVARAFAILVECRSIFDEKSDSRAATRNILFTS